MDLDLDIRKDHELITEFRRDARIIFLELDDLLFTMRMSKDGEDLEELIHDIRVNFRRLISLISFHEPIIRKKSLKTLNRDLNLLLRSFALERTKHVLLKNMERYQDENHQGQSLIDIAHRELALKKNPDKHHLDPMGFRVTYEGTLKTLLGYGGRIFRSGQAEIQGDTQNFYSNRFQELMREVKQLEENMDFNDNKAIHRLRVAAKNIYYTLKSKEGILGELASRRAVYLKEIQNIGGKIHDADVNLRLLSTFTVDEDERGIVEDFTAYLKEERQKKLKALMEWIHQQ